jgi:hypothetical protein
VYARLLSGSTGVSVPSFCAGTGGTCMHTSHAAAETHAVVKTLWWSCDASGSLHERPNRQGLDTAESRSTKWRAPCSCFVNN